MQNIFRRPSGIYVLRLTVPAHLRPVIGRREIISTTGTRELTIAKMVASAQAAKWRQHFFESARLMAAALSHPMDHQELLTIAHGHPMLLSGGHLSLEQAANASGISAADLLKTASDGRLPLYIRAGRVQGHLIPASFLEPVDRVIGPASGLVVPPKDQMPAAAVEHINEGMLRISSEDLDAVTAALLSGNSSVELVLLELPDRPGIVFAPYDPLRVVREALEVAAIDVETIRKAIASTIEPARIKEASSLRRAGLKSSLEKAGKRSQERLSVALNAYVTNRVRRDVGLEGEIKRIENGCALLIELEGDIRLAEVDADRLRQFRDKGLAKVPANENKIRLMHGTKTVADSIRVVDGKGWPVMSVSERDKRMKWISAWFRWLHQQKWISEDPSMSLRGESVVTKAERRKMKSSTREDEVRASFTNEDC